MNPVLGLRGPGAAAAPDRDAMARTLVLLIETLVESAVSARLADRISEASPQATPPARWVSPPVASRVTGVPVKTIRQMIKDRRITARLRNLDQSPVHPKYLVNLEDVAQAAGVRQEQDRASVAPDIKARAARIVAGMARR